MRTPEEAKGLLCPFARTFAETPAVAGCRGPVCLLWRWEQITTSHPLWRAAVRAKAAETGEKGACPEAAGWVAANLVQLGIVPTRGFCGAGGAP